MVSNVLIAAEEMEKIDAEFAEEDESDDQEEVNAEETASNIRKAVRMMSQQFKKK
jgi:F0F1-type ATP synthase epsilon subunit